MLRRLIQPHRFDIFRTAGRSLGFGQGIHICMGGGLARCELEIALSAPLRAAPTYGSTPTTRRYATAPASPSAAFTRSPCGFDGRMLNLVSMIMSGFRLRASRAAAVLLAQLSEMIRRFAILCEVGSQLRSRLAGESANTIKKISQIATDAANSCATTAGEPEA